MIAWQVFGPSCVCVCDAFQEGPDTCYVIMSVTYEIQTALNAVYDFCEMWQLTVNTEKTEIVIFSRAKVQIFPTFVYGHKHIKWLMFMCICVYVHSTIMETFKQPQLNRFLKPKRHITF